MRTEVARQRGGRALTSQEAVADPFVLPPGVSLGHLLQGLDPLENRRSKKPGVGHSSTSGARRGCWIWHGGAHERKVCSGGTVLV